MLRPLLRILPAAALFCLAACASKETAATPPPTSPTPKPVKSATVITVAKNGGVEVNHKAVPLKNLAATLKQMGVTKNSKFSVEGENGTNPEDIEEVMNVLVINGFLPANTID